MLRRSEQAPLSIRSVAAASGARPGFCDGLRGLAVRCRSDAAIGKFDIHPRSRSDRGRRTQGAAVAVADQGETPRQHAAVRVGRQQLSGTAQTRCPAVAQGVLAAGLLVQRSRGWLGATVAVNGLAVAAWVVSRTNGIPAIEALAEREPVGAQDLLASIALLKPGQPVRLRLWRRSPSEPEGLEHNVRLEVVERPPQAGATRSS